MRLALLQGWVIEHDDDLDDHDKYLTASHLLVSYVNEICLYDLSDSFHALQLVSAN